MQKVGEFLVTSGRVLTAQFVLVFLVNVVAVLFTFLGGILVISNVFFRLLILAVFFAAALMRGLRMPMQSQGTVMGLYSLVASLLSFISFFYYANPNRFDIPNVFWHFFLLYLPWTLVLSAIGISIAVFIRHKQASKFSIFLSIIGCVLAMGLLALLLLLALGVGAYD